MLRDIILRAGALKVGFARCAPVAPDAHESYLRFISEGRHGAMGYMANHLEIRRNPALLLEDGSARTIVMCAFPYFTPSPQAQSTPCDARFAMYARGDDYHTVIRARLAEAVDYLAICGHTSRVCVDSAPLRERYWAVQAGIGFIGVNSQLIVPGAGSYIFLAGIVTSADLPPDTPCGDSCLQCGRCVRACPTGAIAPDGSFDARRCLSYLTIEYRGQLPEGLPLGNRVYGCDTCQMCCPHNSSPAPTSIHEFRPDPAIAALTRPQIAAMTRPQFKALFARSAVKRLRLEGLRRNALHPPGDLTEKC